MDPNGDDQLSARRKLDVETNGLTRPTHWAAAFAEEHCVGMRAAHTHVLQAHPATAVAQAQPRLAQLTTIKYICKIKKGETKQACIWVMMCQPGKFTQEASSLGMGAVTLNVRHRLGSWMTSLRCWGVLFIRLGLSSNSLRPHTDPHMYNPRPWSLVRLMLLTYHCPSCIPL